MSSAQNIVSFVANIITIKTTVAILFHASLQELEGKTVSSVLVHNLFFPLSNMGHNFQSCLGWTLDL